MAVLTSKFHKSRNIFCVCLLFSLAGGFAPSALNAGWKDALGDIKTAFDDYKNKKDGPSEEDISKALKEALKIGARRSVDKLGGIDGFYKDPSVRIPMPKKLQKVDKFFRKLGQKNLMDKFAATMNHAAEQAVKTTYGVLADAIKQMTIADAVRILSGRENEATEYFKEKKSADLQRSIIPIVSNATRKTGVTARYMKIRKKTRKINPRLANQLPDINQYITEKTLQGLFLKISEKEAEIRKNPVARTTELLKKVFGS